MAKPILLQMKDMWQHIGFLESLNVYYNTESAPLCNTGKWKSLFERARREGKAVISSCVFITTALQRSVVTAHAVSWWCTSAGCWCASTSPCQESSSSTEQQHREHMLRDGSVLVPWWYLHQWAAAKEPAPELLSMLVLLPDGCAGRENEPLQKQTPRNTVLYSLLV